MSGREMCSGGMNIEMHLEVCICQEFCSIEMNTVQYKCLWRCVYVWKLLFQRCAPDE
jgi:hypothetical protein